MKNNPHLFASALVFSPSKMPQQCQDAEPQCELRAPNVSQTISAMHDTNFQAAIQLVLKASADGRPQHEVVLTVCETPQYLLDFGFQQLAIVVTGAVVDKAHFDHGITRSVLVRLGEIILNPKALYRSATQHGSAVVVAFELKDGSPLLVPIRPNQAVGRKSVNKVASVYAKEATVEDR